MRKWPILISIMALAYLIGSFFWLFEFNIVIFSVWLLVPLKFGSFIKIQQSSFMQKLFFLALCPILWAVCSILSNYYPGDEYYLYGIGSHIGLWALLFVNADVISWNGSLAIAAAGVPIIVLLGLACVQFQTAVKIFVILFTLMFMLVLITIVVSVGREGFLVGKHGSYLAYILGVFDFALIWSLCLSIVLGGLRRFMFRIF